MKKTIFALILLLIYWSAHSSVYGGKLVVPEDYDRPEGRHLSLYYEWFSGFDSSKATIVVLNGGPGVSYQWYISQRQLFSRLSQTYNLCFYDTRGVGRSSALKKANLEERDLNKYGMKEHALDLQILQQKIIKSEKIILFGHSFGGLTAYNYALEYPGNVSGLIVANMASSLTAVMEGSFYFQSLYSQLIEEVGSTKMFQLRMKDMIGMLMHPEFGAISFNSFLSLLSTAVYSKSGRQDFLNLFNEIYQYNFDMEKFNQLNSTEYKKNLLILNNQEILNSFSRVDNFLLSITSHTHFLSEKVYSELSDEAVKQFYIEQRDAKPDYFSSLYTVEFDISDQIQDIEKPILVIAGKYDPIVPIDWVRKDVDLIRSAGRNITFVEMETGHNPYMEESEEFVSRVAEFLRYL